MNWDKKISKWLVLFCFLGCFLPNSWGKTFAALTALLAVLKYVVPNLTGRMRYLYVMMFPLLICLMIRHFSGMLWTWLSECSLETAFNDVLHYFSRLYETVVSVYHSFGCFLQTWDFKHLSVLGTNFQFLVILVSIPLCLYATCRNRGRILAR